MAQGTKNNQWAWWEYVCPVESDVALESRFAPYQGHLENDGRFPQLPQDRRRREIPFLQKTTLTNLRGTSRSTVWALLHSDVGLR